MMSIHFRPHHFLCALCFRGKGYSPAFIDNFASIMATLSAYENTKITITLNSDNICHPCPHRRDMLCQSQEKIAVLDQAHAQALDLKEHQTITWEEAKQLIKEKMTLNRFHQICSSCQWKRYGICENVLSEFLDKETSSSK